MTAQDSFERIQSFKQHSSALVDGVNYARVVATYLYGQTPRDLLKQAVFSFFFRTRVTVAGSPSGPLVVYSFRRKRRRDYDYIVDFVEKTIGTERAHAEIDELPSATQWARTAIDFPRAWRASKGFRAPWARRLCAALLIAKFLSSADAQIRQLVTGRETVFAFCDAAPHDNLAVQLANLTGALTVTAQHGQYRVLDHRSMSSDAEAYANFVSDRMLCWGQATAEQFALAGIDASRMRAVGWLREWPDSRVGSPRTGEFGVMLNGINGAESNAAMLAAAEAIGAALDLQYVVRTHPSFGLEQYAALVGERGSCIGPMSTEDFITRVEFAVSHSSSAALEMIQLDVPVFVLDDGHLPGVFAVGGLSYRGIPALVDAVSEDRARGLSERAQRLAVLRDWFNEPCDQHASVARALDGGA